MYGESDSGDWNFAMIREGVLAESRGFNRGVSQIGTLPI